MMRKNLNNKARLQVLGTYFDNLMTYALSKGKLLQSGLKTMFQKTIQIIEPVLP